MNQKNNFHPFPTGKKVLKGMVGDPCPSKQSLLWLRRVFFFLGRRLNMPECVTEQKMNRT
jgi:hypothetical protein